MGDKTNRVANQAARMLVRKALSTAAKAIITKLGIPMLAISLAMMMFFMGISLVLGAFFTPMDGQSGLFNFTNKPETENDIAVNQALLQKYQDASAATVDRSTQNQVPMTSTYLVPWGYFAAVDKVSNNCEAPAPEDYIDDLMPNFTFIELPKTVIVCGDEGCSINVTQVKLIDTANTYSGTYTHKYKMVTTSTERTTITQPVLEQIIPPTPANYIRLFSLLARYQITTEYDRKIVLLLAGNYNNGGTTDLNTPSDLSDVLMNGGGMTYSVGSPPPSEYIPYFEQAAQRFHGATDVDQFEALLMAICYTESSFATYPMGNTSSAGAQGPMQFLPSSWLAYGGELGYSSTDIWDVKKSIMGAANMLSQQGAAMGSISGIQQAVFGYNHSSEYVNLVVGRMYFYGKYSGWMETNPQGFTWPVPGYFQITDPFGTRTHPVTGQTNSYHTGIDIAAPLGADIVATKDGTITSIVSSDSIYGTSITIDHGNGQTSFYGHMSQSYVRVGQHVSVGQSIAPVGSEGRSTGPHLHFELRLNGIATNPVTIVPPPRI